MNALKRSSAIAALCVVGMAAPAVGQTAVVYVDIENGSLTPANFGQDGWGGDAHRFLQDALDDAAWLIDNELAAEVEIWVAATGHYRPDQRAINGSGAPCPPYGDCLRVHAFEMRNNVSILGGFVGDEDFRHERRPLENVTVLSGELKCIDPIGSPCVPAGPSVDNSQNVVRSQDNNSSARLDGFHIIESRRAFGGSPGALAIIASDPVIANCTFRNNQHFWGSAATLTAWFEPSHAQFINCIFHDNEMHGSESASGTIYVAQGSELVMVNCLLYANTGPTAGVFVGNTSIGPDHLTMINCTIADNNGIGVRTDNYSATIVNSILWGNTGEPGYELEQWQLLSTNVNINYSIIEGLDVFDNGTNLHADPLFRQPSVGDYRLLYASPAIDTGSDAAVPDDLFDINENGVTIEPVPDLDWYDRIQLVSVDIGAFEAELSCTSGNPPAFEDCNNNGIPDDCDIHWWGTSQDCNNNGIPDECDISSGTSQDCNSNGIPDECDIAYGTSSDCNENGIPDECDISSGTSQDCNSNGIPDECDIPDCNENGIPDECEIADGAPHCNGVLDECIIICGDAFPIDVVFILDTSGSMGGEYTGASGICTEVVAALESHLLATYPTTTINVSVLELGTSSGICGSSNLLSFFGGAPVTVPGNNGACVSELGNLSGHDEAWATATSIVAAGYPWENGLRFAIPIGDEAPCSGNHCSEPKEADSIANAISLSLANSVRVLTISGTGSPACVMDYADDLSIATLGGPAFHRNVDTYPVIGAALISRIDAIIAEVPPCECECSCGPDLNCDDVVDVADLLLLLEQWGVCADPLDCPADLNDDGRVDVADLLILLGEWGAYSCITLSGAGDDVPQTVQDCYDRYFTVDINLYEDCLHWIAEQEGYLP